MSWITKYLKTIYVGNIFIDTKNILTEFVKSKAKINVTRLVLIMYDFFLVASVVKKRNSALFDSRSYCACVFYNHTQRLWL